MGPAPRHRLGGLRSHAGAGSGSRFGFRSLPTPAPCSRSLPRPRPPPSPDHLHHHHCSIATPPRPPGTSHAALHPRLAVLAPESCRPLLSACCLSFARRPPTARALRSASASILHPCTYARHHQHTPSARRLERTSLVLTLPSYHQTPRHWHVLKRSRPAISAIPGLPAPFDPQIPLHPGQQTLRTNIFRSVGRHLQYMVVGEPA